MAIDLKGFGSSVNSIREDLDGAPEGVKETIEGVMSVTLASKVAEGLCMLTHSLEAALEAFPNDPMAPTYRKMLEQMSPMHDLQKPVLAEYVDTTTAVLDHRMSVPPGQKPVVH